ncbi:MAG TPA: hypothetical protein VEJ16_04815 [Alphaproteobacteria bacterium]|nr:hypothetical protein [Alphaproteobacteria bacterium]
MSLFTSLRRSPSAAGILIDNDTLLPWHAFDADIERSLRMLRGVHIPVSMFAVGLGEVSRGSAAEAVGDALSRYGSVGRLADGRIGLLYLGPRSLEQNGNAVLANQVHKSIERRLHERGWSGLIESLDLAAAHGWTDEIFGSIELIRMLGPSRARV